MIAQRTLAAAAMLVALGLAGCGMLSDETAGRVMMSPGRFDVYPCANIEQAIREARMRRTELEQLMARSSQTPGGELVNALAYRSEYVQKGGELRELAKAADDKKCSSESQWSSGRRVY